MQHVSFTPRQKKRTFYIANLVFVMVAYKIIKQFAVDLAVFFVFVCSPHIAALSDKS